MIVFVDYKYKGIGGVGQLVTNTVLELNRKGLLAKVYASHDSYEYNRLKDEKANCILIDSEKVKIKHLSSFLDMEDVIFLTHLDNVELLDCLYKINNKIIFYTVHPDTFFIDSRFFSLCNYTSKALQFIALLEKKNALYIMDRTNADAIERRGLELTKPINYLPVPIRIDKKLVRSQNDHPLLRNVTYIGRGNDDWKIYPVIKILQDLNKLEGNYKFTICTDKDVRYKELIDLYVPNNKLIIEYKINLFGSELDEFLIKFSWLHISMGTSALEGAKLGIPTILIDYSKNLFPDNYVYKWLFEADGFSLADEILPNMIMKGRPLEDIVIQLEIDNSYSHIAELCFKYVMDNHSLSTFVDKLNEACKVSEMTVQDYCNSSLTIFLKYIKPPYKYFALFLSCIRKYVNSNRNMGKSSLA